MEALRLIDKYYPTNSRLKEVLLAHSRQVCQRVMLIAMCHPELRMDEQLLHDGALLHDIGIFMTDAPSIYCTGHENYLLHGYLGAKLLREEGFPELAHICERHTGAGLTKETILNCHLNIPVQDYLPVTLEEKAVCYADKFYSKSHLYLTRDVEYVYNNLLSFGCPSADRFMEWHNIFG